MRLSILMASLVVLGVPARRASAQRTPSTRSTTQTRAASKNASLSAAEQRRRQPDYITGQYLRDLAAGLRDARALGRSAGVAADEQTAYLLVRRAASSDPEVHSRWDDFVIVRSGTGALLMGEQLRDGRSPAPGERRGGTVVKPIRLVLNPGDIARIPAGVPHAFEVNPKLPLEYLLIKVRHAQLPLD